MNWIESLPYLNKENQGHVLITILSTRGSSPRDTGSKMVITNNKTFDTIGGGTLEFEVIKQSRKLLSENQKIQQTQIFNLGKDLKQCCGGTVTIFFEIFPATNFNIVIFGAGHIGKSVIKILEDIDCHVKWFDSRTELFPENSASHIQKFTMKQAELTVECCMQNSYFLIMTHDHALDQTLCEAIISKGDSHYCGLIGSHTKSLKFKQRMKKKGYSQLELERLTCPMGLSSIKTKKPMEIAVSIVAELLIHHKKRSKIDISHQSQIISIESS